MTATHGPSMALLAGCAMLLVASLGAHVAAQEGNVVEVQALPSPDLAFAPDRIEIETGTTVRWVNSASVIHTVTSSDSIEFGKRTSNGAYNAQLNREGDTFEFTFEEAGTFYYFCVPHSQNDMVGTIVATGGDGESSDSPALGLVVPVALLFGAAFVLRRAK